jgi:S-DNA-T family DNA segregation ATPase FtsK/SpoIIIE
MAAGVVAVFWMPLAFGLEGAWWVLRQRHVSPCLMLATLITFLLSTTLAWVGLLTAIVGLVAAGVRSPRAFGQPVREFKRHKFYERGWTKSMTLCGLMKRDATTPLVPRLVSVRCSQFFDHLTIHLQPGQKKADVQAASDAIAATFGSEACRVRSLPKRPWQPRGTRVRIDLQRKDALLETIEPLPIPEKVDLEAVAIGRTEYGDNWLVNLLGTHILVGGATGAGKASVLWSMVRGMAPVVRDGLVELWGIDPKNGVELIHGKGMFTRYVGEGAGISDMVSLLADLVNVMEDRSERLAATKRRKHEITREDPLIVCFIDELGDITLCGDKDKRGNMVGDISKLLRRARAVGITLVLILQDPRKDSVPFRDLVPDGIGLRLSEPFQIDAVCGHGAYAAGARCLDIPGAPEDGSPMDGRGVAYMTKLGVTTPLRVRASYITDDDLAEMVELYPAFDRSRVSDAEAIAQEFDVDDDEREPSEA